MAALKNNGESVLRTVARVTYRDGSLGEYLLDVRRRDSGKETILYKAAFGNWKILKRVPSGQSGVEIANEMVQNPTVLVKALYDRS